MLEADYVIVGGGAAGCVVAARLSEDPKVRVLLLEAGPRDWHPWIHVPAACLFLQHDARFNWLDASEPQSTLDGRRVKIPQGKMLGGSGSLNGMLHVRPQPEDIADWNTRGWDWETLEPILAKAESYAPGGPGRGQQGILTVSDFSDTHPLTRAFIEACTTAGIPANPDMNGPVRRGASPFQQARKGRFRSQTAQSYLRAARKRPNLQVQTGAQVTRVVFDGRRAVGVRFRRGGTEHDVRASREVVLCAGAMRSPQLLQVSGIGDPAHLAKLGVPVVASSPAVGRDMRDHFLLRVAHRVGGIATINERTRGLSVVREVLRYVFKGEGMLTMGAGAAAAILSLDGETATPNVQISFAPGSFSGPGTLEREPGMTIGAWLSPGESRGTVMAVDADTATAPAIDPRYLSAESDRQGIVACIRLIRSLFEEPALARWSRGETLPGPETPDDAEAILAFARDRGASGYHFAGTCRMGDDAASVVDGALRVRGTEGLRVVDASVMPTPPIGNAHATVVMLAERGASLIAARS